MILTSLLLTILCFVCLFKHFFIVIIQNYSWTQATAIFIHTFCSSAKLLKGFREHTHWVNSIDYSAYSDDQLICSGSIDKTVRVWDMETKKKFNYSMDIQVMYDQTIRFWDIKNGQQLEKFNVHTDGISGIEFSPFDGGRYLCSGSWDKTICLWDIETFKSLHVFNGHEGRVWCVDMSPLQSSNNSKSDNIGKDLIGGNGYTICSGSYDNTVRIWDIEKTKSFIIFKGHIGSVMSVRYGSNELGINGGANTILSGSIDKSVRLWDIRSGQQIQVFNGHMRSISAVDYSPFIVNNIEVGSSSNVICSGSYDNTIRFWDIRSNKNELHAIKGNDKIDDGILCLKFVSLKRKRKDSRNNDSNVCGVNLCYGLWSGSVCIWG
ncbi:hypothetical protein RFI_32276 [Reticulomyxa filosa]|uniref:G-protein beta WD-40 repeats containing protein n=1 Tax=Reticulomyxa filosa TaxID=46433 RepID=X6LWL5_RETFI|nr:hypothetical protein RFI_32276 [Reticulomyxa filosa]|eukprot:ETO05120.1 hypothetical protein RFI_32276 [Reticulomyxa filosa]